MGRPRTRFRNLDAEFEADLTAGGELQTFHDHHVRRQDRGEEGQRAEQVEIREKHERRGA